MIKGKDDVIKLLWKQPQKEMLELQPPSLLAS